ncbi:protein of unknown function [Methylocaldum szegediense]|uniref:Uncharacterized protein n=1 Tax=Methylocaldum szegediense TaxID=73780 RepID=A0ABN8X6V6_9GAMM|nr:protein of unknown function [Methylocaldum szegediense]
MQKAWLYRYGGIRRRLHETRQRYRPAADTFRESGRQHFVPRRPQLEAQQSSVHPAEAECGAAGLTTPGFRQRPWIRGCLRDCRILSSDQDWIYGVPWFEEIFTVADSRKTCLSLRGWYKLKDRVKDVTYVTCRALAKMGSYSASATTRDIVKNDLTQRVK